MNRPPEGVIAVPPCVAVLEPFVAAGVFEPAEVQLAATLARLQPAVPDEVLLALALAARGTRLGQVCVEPAGAGRAVVGTSEEDSAALPWPDPDQWVVVLARSDLVADPAGSAEPPLRPLVWDGTRLYLQRYWHHESTVAERLLALAAAGSAGPPPAELAAALDLAFPPGEAEWPADGAGYGRSMQGARSAVPGDEAEVAVLLPEARPPLPVDRQRLAAERTLTNRISVIAGGPGTGKTRTVAGLLEAAHRMAQSTGQPLHVALAAPTGKAAGRMAEALGAAVSAGEAEGRIPPELARAVLANRPTTLHRLLGPLPGARFRHDRHHPLPHDLIVVDEASMVSLPLMSGLLAAARPDARLALVGDPHQLASVEAGSVLRDVVGPLGHAFPGVPPADDSSAAPPTAIPRPPGGGPGTPAGPAWRTESGDAAAPLSGRVTVLRRVHRFSVRSAIAALAETIQAGDAERTMELLRTPSAETTWVREDDPAADAVLADEVIDAAEQVVEAARAGEALVGLRASLAVKVLSATRAGARHWSERIERGVADRVPGLDHRNRWYIGRPVMLTANDHLNRLANGDVGLVVGAGGRSLVALETGGSVRLMEPSQLGPVDTWWAMTIHKSQGSEFDHAVIALPAGPSPILSRELLYTAVTRARRRVTILGNEARIREAVARPVARASGLRDRLWQPEPGSPGLKATTLQLAATPCPPMGDRAGIHQDGHTPPLPSRI